MKHLTQTTPIYWRECYPPYHSLKGWEFEKKLIADKIKKEFKK